MRAKTSQSEGANEQNQHGDAAVIKTSDGASGCGVDECADNALCEAIGNQHTCQIGIGLQHTDPVGIQASVLHGASERIHAIHACIDGVKGRRVSTIALSMSCWLRLVMSLPAVGVGMTAGAVSLCTS